MSGVFQNIAPPPPPPGVVPPPPPVGGGGGPPRGGDRGGGGKFFGRGGHWGWHSQEYIPCPRGTIFPGTPPSDDILWNKPLPSSSLRQSLEHPSYEGIPWNTPQPPFPHRAGSPSEKFLLETACMCVGGLCIPLRKKFNIL
jgi:hypothetical protein